MTRLVVDTASAPAWEPGASVEVRLIAPDVEHTVTGTLVAARSPADPSPEPLREAITVDQMAAAIHEAEGHRWHKDPYGRGPDHIDRSRAADILGTLTLADLRDPAPTAAPTAGAGGLDDVERLKSLVREARFIVGFHNRTPVLGKPRRCLSGCIACQFLADTEPCVNDPVKGNQK